MTLPGRTKRDLRSRGQNLEPALMVGKQGVTDNVLKTLRELMESRDLIKVKITAEDGDERAAQAGNLAASIGAELVGVVGKTALIYRPVPPKAG
jgi:RNA-binding protein